MIWPATYLLVWLLILGAALAYADEWTKNWIMMRVCAVTGNIHPLHDRRILLRKSSVIAVSTVKAARPLKCVRLTFTNGSQFYVEGTIEGIKKDIIERGLD